MAFKLLRLHGRKVSADVFENFKKGDEFFCFAGQSSQAVTGMFNLYRASQLLFPGEKILEDAKDFSSKFLRQKQASNELLDKWIIMKDLPGEVGYALEVPWYASLPRVETRFYIQQYGAEHDVWIGKTLYRMTNVSNNEYLELAKLDYNNCQAAHSKEWDKMQRWYSECKLGDYGLSRISLLMAYFLAVANIFEAERATERLAWAKTSALIHTIASHFHNQQTTRTAFVNEFRTCNNMRDYVISRRWNTNQKGHGLVKALLGTLNHLSLDTLIEHGQDISGQLRQAWEKWLLKWEEAGDSHQGEAELLVQTLNLSAGRTITEGQVSSNPQYEQLFNITNRVCRALRIYQIQKHHQEFENGSYDYNTECTTTPEIESDMQELVEMVLGDSSDGIDSKVKQTFLTVAKTFYYGAYCDSGTINYHIGKVLFDRVD